VESELMTFPEVVAASRQPEATMRWLIHAGKGPRHAKIGRRLVFRRADVEAWIDEAFQRAAAVRTPAAS
jgi:predicted DNA-binding transcriptional regulator AlpA